MDIANQSIRSVTVHFVTDGKRHRSAPCMRVTCMCLMYSRRLGQVGPYDAAGALVCRRRCSDDAAGAAVATCMRHRAHCMEMTSSTKPEVHNVLHCRQTRIKARQQATSSENLVKIRHILIRRNARGQTRSSQISCLYRRRRNN